MLPTTASASTGLYRHGCEKTSKNSGRWFQCQKPMASKERLCQVLQVQNCRMAMERLAQR